MRSVLSLSLFLLLNHNTKHDFCNLPSIELDAGEETSDGFVTCHDS